MQNQLELSTWLHQGGTPDLRRQMQLVLQLSIPAVLAELSTIAMQYIDAAMVGSLGGGATAAIGLVSSTTWLFTGLCTAAAAGFSVQAAQLIGAQRIREARNVLRQALLASLALGLLLLAVGVSISAALPVWLGGEADICPDSSRYFFIYACALPAAQFRLTAGGMLQCSGDMRTPSLLNIFMCGLDVVLNTLLIFPTRRISILGLSITVIGAGLGVAGAAIGTALAQAAAAALMLYALCFRSPRLRLTGGGSWRFDRRCLRKALRLALPMAFEHGVLSGAQIVSTRIVAPLGTVSIAANSLAVTAESLCYMPGYGVGAAATTLVGQSIGAQRPDMARRFAWLSVAMGAAVMTCTGGLMYLFAPQMLAMLTPDAAVRALGARVLRIEAFAEPLYAASLVTAGALRGAGDTLIPGVLNLMSMWGVRITSAAWLAPRFGLPGVWMAMCCELCVRGLLFLFRLWRGKWISRCMENAAP